jgi:hypothetical protein
LTFHATSLASVRVNGVTPPPLPPRWTDSSKDGWHQVFVRGASDAEVEIVTNDASVVDAIAVDTTYGLPPAGATLTRARDGSLCVPTDDGDVTQTMTHARW